MTIIQGVKFVQEFNAQMHNHTDRSLIEAGFGRHSSDLPQSVRKWWSNPDDLCAEDMMEIDRIAGIYLEETEL